MGRRALRTGDMVAPKERMGTLDLWGQPENNIDSSDIVVRGFELGLLLCIYEYEWRSGKRATKALVFDNRAAKFGWVDIRYIRRVE